MGTEDCEAKGTDAGGRRGEDVHLLRVRRAADTGSLSTLFSVPLKVSVKFSGVIPTGPAFLSNLVFLSSTFNIIS